MGTSYSWGNSSWTQEENFSQWEQSAIGIISPGKWWIPQYWTLQGFGWTGFWAILSRLGFCRGRLDRMILEVPSNLVFCDLSIDKCSAGEAAAERWLLKPGGQVMFVALSLHLWLGRELWIIEKNNIEWDTCSIWLQEAVTQGCMRINGSVPLDFGRGRSCSVVSEYDVLGGEYSPPLVTSQAAAGPQMCLEVVSH